MNWEVQAEEVKPSEEPEHRKGKGKGPKKGDIKAAIKELKLLDEVDDLLDMPGRSLLPLPVLLFFTLPSLSIPSLPILILRSNGFFAFITSCLSFSLLDVIYFPEYTVQSMKAVDDQAAGVAKKKSRVLAAAVGEAFYAVRFTRSYPRTPS